MSRATHEDPRSDRGVLDPVRDVLGRWPLTTFWVVTLAISWPLGLLPPGPSIAALLVTALLEGRAGVGALLRTITIWRVGVRWYVVALVGPVVLVAAAIGLDVAMGGEIVAGSRLFDWPALGRLFAVQVFVLGGPWEELGWRGYALPRLLRRTTPLMASLGLGVFWALWHVPLFLSGDVPWVDGLFVVVVSILFTAVFVRTRSSVLIAFLMHAALNAAAGVGIVLFDVGARTRFYWALAIVTSVVAGVVVGLQPRWWTQRSLDDERAIRSGPEPAGDVALAGPAGAVHP